MSLILNTVQNRVGIIQLNNTEKRNALSPQLISELYAGISQFLSNSDIKIIVIKGSETAFCAGADLSYIQTMRNFTDEENLQDIQSLRNLFDLIYNAPKIIISQVEGPALAGGCGLATVCDFCFATPNASFGYTESKIGFVPALVMVYLKEKIPGIYLRELLLTGKIINAQKAKEYFLINEIIDSDINNYVLQFAEKLCISISSESVKTIKEMLRNITGNNLIPNLDYASDMNVKARKSADCIKGIDSFINKEKISW